MFKARPLFFASLYHRQPQVDVANWSESENKKFSLLPINVYPKKGYEFIASTLKESLWIRVR